VLVLQGAAKVICCPTPLMLQLSQALVVLEGFTADDLAGPACRTARAAHVVLSAQFCPSAHAYSTIVIVYVCLRRVCCRLRCWLARAVPV
jgi:hypothetical protein